MNQKQPLMLSVFSTFAIGGPQVRFLRLVSHLGNAWRHAIISMDGDMTCAEYISSNINVTYPKIINRKGETIRNLYHFRRLLQEWTPDVMVTHNWGTIEWTIANCSTLTRHIHIEDGFGPEEVQKQIMRRVWPRRAFLRYSNLVVPSRVLEDIAINQWWIPRSRVHFIPNGIDTKRFRPFENKTNGNDFIVGTIAALRPEKNIGRLIRAIAIVCKTHSVRLSVVGDGPERSNIAMQANDLGILNRITFHGEQRNTEEFYSKFDIFALSSDTEQMPIAVLEAMASGLPIVSTDVGDIRHMISSDNASLIVPKNEHDIAKAIMFSIENNEIRRRIGKSNREKVEKEFDERIMFSNYDKIFGR